MNYYQMWLNKKSQVLCRFSKIWNQYHVLESLLLFHFYIFIMHFVLKLKYVYVVMFTHTHVCVHVCADMSACVHVECMVHPLKFWTFLSEFYFWLWATFLPVNDGTGYGVEVQHSHSITFFKRDIPKVLW